MKISSKHHKSQMLSYMKPTNTILLLAFPKVVISKALNTEGYYSLKFHSLEFCFVGWRNEDGVFAVANSLVINQFDILFTFRINLEDSNQEFSFP